jgi:mannan endo-1,4-beta-mannosidase
MYCTSGADFSIWHQQGYGALLAAVDQFVAEYTSKHIVVIVECHDWWANQAQTDQFWTDMASRYRDNPYVWFNAMNEPAWNDNAQWLSLQRHYLQIVRGQGAENVFVADVMNAGQDAGWGGALPIFDPSMGPALRAGQCNVLFSHHDYGGVDDGIGSVAYWDRVHAANLAMVVGEFGYTIDGSSTAGTYQQNVNGANSVFTSAADNGIGMLWWHATHGDNYSLKNSGDAFYADGGDSANLSAAGLRLWSAAHPAPTPSPFTGDLGASGCASAGAT